MKIIEILAADQENPIHGTRLPPHRVPDQDLMAHIANAFTRDPAVKLLWDLTPPTNRLKQTHPSFSSCQRARIRRKFLMPKLSHRIPRSRYRHETGRADRQSRQAEL